MTNIGDVGQNIMRGLEVLPSPDIREALTLSRFALSGLAGVALSGDEGGLSEAMDAVEEAIGQLRKTRNLLRDGEFDLLDFCRVTGVLDRAPALGSETPVTAGVSLQAEKSPELVRQIEAQRVAVMEEGFDTFRTIASTHEEMGRQMSIDIRQIVTGKVVCDMGSGQGGLAKSMQAEGIPGTVYSLNPRLANPEYKMREAREGRTALRIAYPHLTADDLSHIQQHHDRYAIPKFAHEVDLPDESADAVLDMYAVHAYMLDSPELYALTVQQYFRILKPGCAAYVYDPNHQRPRMDTLLDSRKAAAEAAGFTWQEVVNPGFEYVVGMILQKP